MSFEITFADDGNYYRHEDDPISVTVFDGNMRQLGVVFHPEAEDYGIAVHLPTNRFVVGYWSTADLTLFDFNSGEIRNTFPFREIAPLIGFDESGTRLLFKSGSKVVLLNVETAEAITIPDVRALESSIVLGNQVIVPSRKKDELRTISLLDGSARVLHVPIGATLFNIYPCPNENALIAIDRKQVVHRINIDDGSIVWSTSFRKAYPKRHISVGQLSGNGRLFGTVVTELSGNMTVVLNAATGEILRELPDICYGLPHHGNMVRDNDTVMNGSEFKTLDLETGEKGIITLG